MVRALPALLAALMLCLLPACGSTPRLEPAPHTVEVMEPSGVRYAAPARAVQTPRITRVAGQWCPPATSTDGGWFVDLVLLVFYGLIYLGYSVYYLLELMAEAAMADDIESEEAEGTEKTPPAKDEWMP